MRWATVIPAAILLSPQVVLAQDARLCVDLVSQLIEASDTSWEQSYKAATWPDGEWTGREESIRFHDVYFRGAGRVARTFQQDVRGRNISPAVQEVTNKEIVQHYRQGHYYGFYVVSRNRYLCERRANEWRIVSLEVLSISAGTNEAAAQEWQRIVNE